MNDARARSGLFLPLDAQGVAAVRSLAFRAGFSPDGQGVAAYLLHEARQPSRMLPRLASDAVAFAKANPQLVATAANVARALIKR